MVEGCRVMSSRGVCGRSSVKNYIALRIMAFENVMGQNNCDHSDAARQIAFLLVFVSAIGSLPLEKSYSQIRLPRLVCDGMVLQRDVGVRIWGWASPGEEVTIRFLDRIDIATTGTDNRWVVTLPSMKAGGPYGMQIDGSNHITLKNIMIGDVWVCSGQSNMELPMKRVSPIYGKEITNSANEYIRQFYVPQKYNFSGPQDDLESGSWISANPQSVLNFSAVAYFYGKELYDKYRVPIGLINASLGGSPAESWMTEQALKSFPEYLEEARRFKDSSLVRNIEEGDNKRIGAWYGLLAQKDSGYKDAQGSWYRPGMNTSGWEAMKIPGYWTSTGLGPVNGAVWFRREFDVPSQMAGKAAKLNLGRIVDADSAFVNGIFVGTVGYQYPPRRYEIPEGVLHDGRNTIVVRIISNAGQGGFVPDKPYEIVEGDQTIDLKGEWKYRVGATMEPLASQTFIRWKPEGLHNAMLAPLLSYRIKGVIWYQGESNTGKPLEYRDLFTALIKDWRQGWQQGDIPFLFVQLPNFMKPSSEPSESNWALLREAQLKTLSLPNTAMAVTIDIGEWNDVHPLDKKDVGRRLALAAQRMAYGDTSVVYSGPAYKSMSVEGNRINLSFSSIGRGLTVKGGEDLKCFAIAGNDRKFVWAHATIEGDKVIISSDEVPNPVAVRYAWADNPEGANLYNKDGLPATPFRTDDWTTMR
jgi:sialate O-acetylesterase